MSSKDIQPCLPRTLHDATALLSLDTSSLLAMRAINIFSSRVANDASLLANADRDRLAVKTARQVHRLTQGFRRDRGSNSKPTASDNTAAARQEQHAQASAPSATHGEPHKVAEGDVAEGGATSELLIVMMMFEVSFDEDADAFASLLADVASLLEQSSEELPRRPQFCRTMADFLQRVALRHPEALGNTAARLCVRLVYLSHDVDLWASCLAFFAAHPPSPLTEPEASAFLRSLSPSEVFTTPSACHTSLLANATDCAPFTIVKVKKPVANIFATVGGGPGAHHVTLYSKHALVHCPTDAEDWDADVATTRASAPDAAAGCEGTSPLMDDPRPYGLVVPPAHAVIVAYGTSAEGIPEAACVSAGEGHWRLDVAPLQGSAWHPTVSWRVPLTPGSRLPHPGSNVIAASAAPHGNSLGVSAAVVTVVDGPTRGVAVAEFRLLTAPSDSEATASEGGVGRAIELRRKLTSRPGVGLLLSTQQSVSLTHLRPVASLLAVTSIATGPCHIELWCLPTNLDDVRTLYACGQRECEEIFIEVRLGETGIQFRGGHRAPKSGSCSAVVEVPGATFGTDWYHVSLSFDRRVWCLTVNGVHSATKDASRRKGFDWTASTVAPAWLIGKGYAGYVADLRIWNRARPPAIVARDMQRHVGRAEPGLVVLLPLRDGHGSCCLDHGPRGVHGLCKGATWVSVERGPSPAGNVGAAAVGDAALTTPEFALAAPWAHRPRLAVDTSAGLIAIAATWPGSGGKAFGLWEYDLRTGLLLSERELPPPPSGGDVDILGIGCHGKLITLVYTKLGDHSAFHLLKLPAAAVEPTLEWSAVSSLRGDATNTAATASTSTCLDLLYDVLCLWGTAAHEVALRRRTQPRLPGFEAHFGLGGGAGAGGVQLRAIKGATATRDLGALLSQLETVKERRSRREFLAYLRLCTGIARSILDEAPASLNAAQPAFALTTDADLLDLLVATTEATVVPTRPTEPKPVSAPPRPGSGSGGEAGAGYYTPEATQRWVLSLFVHAVNSADAETIGAGEAWMQEALALIMPRSQIPAVLVQITRRRTHGRHPVIASLFRCVLSRFCDHDEAQALLELSSTPKEYRSLLTLLLDEDHWTFQAAIGSGERPGSAALLSPVGAKTAGSGASHSGAVRVVRVLASVQRVLFAAALQEVVVDGAQRTAENSDSTMAVAVEAIAFTVRVLRGAAKALTDATGVLRGQGASHHPPQGATASASTTTTARSSPLRVVADAVFDSYLGQLLLETIAVIPAIAADSGATPMLQDAIQKLREPAAIFRDTVLAVSSRHNASTAWSDAGAAPSAGGSGMMQGDAERRLERWADHVLTDVTTVSVVVAAALVRPTTSNSTNGKSSGEDRRMTLLDDELLFRRGLQRAGSSAAEAASKSLLQGVGPLARFFSDWQSENVSAGFTPNSNLCLVERAIFAGMVNVLGLSGAAPPTNGVPPASPAAAHAATGFRMIFRQLKNFRSWLLYLRQSELEHVEEIRLRAVLVSRLEPAILPLDAEERAADRAARGRRLGASSTQQPRDPKADSRAWKTMFAVWKAVKRVRGLMSLMQATDYKDRDALREACLTAVVDFLRQRHTNASQVEWAIQARVPMAQHRHAGLLAVADLLSASGPATLPVVAVCAARCFGGWHVLEGILGAGAVIVGHVRSAFQAILADVVRKIAPSSEEGPSTSGALSGPSNAYAQQLFLSILSAPWEAGDFLQWPIDSVVVLLCNMIADGAYGGGSKLFNARAGRSATVQSRQPTTREASPEALVDVDATDASPRRRRGGDDIRAPPLSAPPSRDASSARRGDGGSESPSPDAPLAPPPPPVDAALASSPGATESSRPRHDHDEGNATQGIASNDVPPSEAVIAIAPPEVIIGPDGCTIRWTAGRGACIGSVPWVQGIGGGTPWSALPSAASGLPPACYYYEVTIVDMSPSGSVAVGLGPRSYNVARPPGWDARSCALHSDDGVLFIESSNGRVAAQGFGLGSTIGCGVNSATHEVFWTIDGRMTMAKVPGFVYDCHPLIGMDLKGVLRVNFGQRDFVLLPSVAAQLGIAPSPRSLALQAKDVLSGFVSSLAVALRGGVTSTPAVRGVTCRSLGALAAQITAQVQSSASFDGPQRGDGGAYITYLIDLLRHLIACAAQRVADVSPAVREACVQSAQALVVTLMCCPHEEARAAAWRALAPHTALVSVAEVNAAIASVLISHVADHALQDESLVLSWWDLCMAEARMAFPLAHTNSRTATVAKWIAACRPIVSQRRRPAATALSSAPDAATEFLMALLEDQQTSSPSTTNSGGNSGVGGDSQTGGATNNSGSASPQRAEWSLDAEVRWDGLLREPRYVDSLVAVLSTPASAAPKLRRTTRVVLSNSSWEHPSKHLLAAAGSGSREEWLVTAADYTLGVVDLTSVSTDSPPVSHPFGLSDVIPLPPPFPFSLARTAQILKALTPAIQNAASHATADRRHSYGVTALILRVLCFAAHAYDAYGPSIANEVSISGIMGVAQAQSLANVLAPDFEPTQYGEHEAFLISRLAQLPNESHPAFDLLPSMEPFAPKVFRSGAVRADTEDINEARQRMAQELSMRGYSLEMCTIALEETHYNRTGALRLLSQHHDDMLRYLEDVDGGGDGDGGDEEDDGADDEEEEEEEGEVEEGEAAAAGGDGFDFEGGTDAGDEDDDENGSAGSSGREEEEEAEEDGEGADGEGGAVSSATESNPESARQTRDDEDALLRNVESGSAQPSGVSFESGGFVRFIFPAAVTMDAEQFVVELYVTFSSLDSMQTIFCRGSKASTHIALGLFDRHLCFGASRGPHPLAWCATPVSSSEVGRPLRVVCVFTQSKLSLAVGNFPIAHTTEPVPPDFAWNAGVDTPETWSLGAHADGSACVRGSVRDLRVWTLSTMPASPVEDTALDVFDRTAEERWPAQARLVLQCRFDEGYPPIRNTASAHSASTAPNSASGAEAAPPFLIPIEIVGRLYWINRQPASSSAAVRFVPAPEVDLSTQLEPMDMFLVDAVPEPFDRTAAWRVSQQCSAAQAVFAIHETDSHLATHYALRVVESVLKSRSTQPQKLWAAPKVMAQTFRRLIDTKGLRSSTPSATASTLPGDIAHFILHAAEKREEILGATLLEMLSLLAVPPDPIVFESSHPTKSTNDPPREVFAPGCRSYHVHYDRHTGVGSTHAQLTFYADASLAQVCARSCLGNFHSFCVPLPRFFFDVRLDGTAAQYGYKMTVLCDVERLVLAANVIAALVKLLDVAPNICGPLRKQGTVTALIRCICKNTGVTRRVLLHAARDLLASAASFPAFERFDLSVLLVDLKRAFERQYRRESNHVLKSCFVQATAEFIAAAKEAASQWASPPPNLETVTAATIKERFEEYRRTMREAFTYRDDGGAERVALLRCHGASVIRVESNSDRTWTIFSDSSPDATVACAVPFHRGRWYFELKLMTGGDIIVGAFDVATPGGSAAVSLSNPSTSIARGGAAWSAKLGPCGVAPPVVTAPEEEAAPPLPQFKTRDVVGVLLDATARTLSFTVNGLAIPGRIELGDLSRAADRADSSAPSTDAAASRSPVLVGVNLSSEQSVQFNFGTVHFEYEPPAGYLPVDPTQLDVGPVVPVNHLRAFVETSLKLISGQPPPHFFAVDSNPFEALKGIREGPPSSSIVPCAGGTIIVSQSEARNNGRVFSTAIADCTVFSGRWYFEVTVLTAGLMQIGWVAPSRFHPRPESGRGVGDDDYSVGIDLFRRVVYCRQRASPLPSMFRRWAAGDVVGCAIDFEAQRFFFSLNGNILAEYEAVSMGLALTYGMAPALSLRSANAASVNMGATPLRFKPDGFKAPSVSDTWLERVDTYYASMLPADVTPAISLSHLKVRETVDNAPCIAVVRLVDVICAVEGINMHQVDLVRNSALLRRHSKVHQCWCEALALHGGDERALLETFRTLKLYDRLVTAAAPLGDAQSHSAITHLLRIVRPLLFASTRDALVNQIIKETNGRGEDLRVTLNRAVSASSDAERHALKTLFGQTFLVLHGQHPRLFRTAQRFWAVVFAGEGAEDVGGPFREHLSSMCAELHRVTAATGHNATTGAATNPGSTGAAGNDGTTLGAGSGPLRLFVPSANNVHNTGEHREAFVPTPSATSELELAMYRFIGALMGGAMRCGEPLSLYFAPHVWKYLVGDPLVESDLDGFDTLCSQVVAEIRQLGSAGGGADAKSAFDEAFSTERFTTALSDGTIVPLLPQGADMPVSLERCVEYANLVVAARLNESVPQLEALRAGLRSVIPHTALSLMSPAQLELRVCGAADYTAEELQESTTCEGLQPDCQRVRLLFQVLAEMTTVQRRLFLRFVSGRERMPVKLRIVPMAVQGDPNAVLPRAATCFFALELPDYSTLDVMRSKLIFAITNCVEIDTDFRARDLDGDVDTGPMLAIGSDDGRRDPLWVDDSERSPVSDAD